MYIEIDFNQVEGYDKLSDTAKKVFERVYKQHNATQGMDYKEKYIPTSVTEYKDHLKVKFQGDFWLHYLPDGTWY